MFTVKFMSFFEDSSTQTSISCPNYQAYKHSDGAYSVTCFKDFTDTDGVERRIMSDDMAKTSAQTYFHCCYVENQSGKTIDRFGPCNA